MMTFALASAAEDGWTLHAEGEYPEYTGAAAANGTLGVLHWKEPFSIRQIVLNNIFELNDETGVNCTIPGPDPLDISMYVDEKPVGEHTDWSQTIDMRHAHHITRFTIEDKVKVEYSITALRNLPNMMLLKASVSALAPTDITIAKKISFPDGYRNQRNIHKNIWAEGRNIAIQQASARTAHDRHDVTAASIFIYDPAEASYAGDSDKSVLRFTMDAGDNVEFCIAGAICTTSEYSDPYSEVQRELIYAERMGIDTILEGHRKLWEELWESDIEIKGDTEAQKAVRFALYNLYSSCREGTGLSIPPMGLSSQGYNGHIFWDTELWMYPPMLLLNPGIARSMIDYRTARMEAAAKKASDYGYKGLMFPWESDSEGQESTPVWALTGPMEHHVTADIGIAVWNYWCVSGDKGWLHDEGWPLLKGIAEFWCSRVTDNNDGTYSVNGVVGADEYARNVNDNAYTNGAVKVALQNAVKAAGICGYKAPSEWKRIAEGLRILTDTNGVTLEYDGYAGEMIKQADVNLLAYPLGIVTDKEQMLRDLRYYEDKIDMTDGPAMTFSILAIQYARIGDAEKASEMFRKAYKPNMREPFGVFAETPASSNPYFMTGAGGLLQAVLFGFGGLEITDKGIRQTSPLLPEGWESLTIRTKEKTFFIGNRQSVSQKR